MRLPCGPLCSSNLELVHHDHWQSLWCWWSFFQKWYRKMRKYDVSIIITLWIVCGCVCMCMRVSNNMNRTLELPSLSLCSLIENFISICILELRGCGSAHVYIKYMHSFIRTYICTGTYVYACIHACSVMHFFTAFWRQCFIMHWTVLLEWSVTLPELSQEIFSAYRLRGCYKDHVIAELHT